MVAERVQRERADRSEERSSAKPRRKPNGRSEGHDVRSLQRTLGNQAVQELHRRGELDEALGRRPPAEERDRESDRPEGAEREGGRPAAAPGGREPPTEDDEQEDANEEVEPADERVEDAEEPGTEAAPPTAAATGADAPESPDATPAGGAVGERGPANPGGLTPVNGDRPAERLAERGIQAKLAVGRPNDAFEREADAVAEAVATGRPAPPVSTLPARGRGGAPGEERREEDDADREAADPREPEERSPREGAEGEEAEPVQALAAPGAGTPELSSSTAATIRNPGTGRPLSEDVRSRVEPRLGTRLDGVQVHDGPSAASAAADLGARAFTHGDDVFLGGGESPRDLRLMAHEATHVVQQEAAAPAADVQRFIPDWVREKLNDYARHIPGWTLFTVIIGYNPLLGSNVERTPMNLLEGLLGLVPFGTYIFDLLNEHGILQDAFDWVVGELDRLDLSLDRLERTIEAAWDDVSLVRGFSYNIDVVKRHFGALYDDVMSFASSVVSHIMGLIKEALIGVAEELLAENEAWALIKKVLGYDPLRDEEVEATPTEILEDFLLLIGAEQHLEQMRERGTVEETAEWIATQIERFTGLLGQLSGLIARAWEAIQPENLPNLMSNIQSLAQDVWGFLQDVWDFASTVAGEVLSRIKDALLGWLSSFAHNVPGFHLLTVIIEKNPFTGEEVPRTAENLIRGFISLLPGGAAAYDRLAESGTIAEAAARIEGAMAELGISWELIVGIFTGIWESLSIEDLIDPIGAFERVVDRIREPISRLFAFINVVLRELFFVVLELMGFPSDLVGSIIDNVIQAIEDIRSDPVGFLLNMLEAVKVGFENFFGGILSYLGRGLVDWLFRGLRAANVEPPADFSLGSVLEFVLGVLGVSTERLWEKLAERIGQENVERIRGAIDRLTGILAFVRDVQERGVTAIWEYVQSQISGLWDMVLETVQEWVMERIINRAIRWLAGLLDPTGVMAVINSFQAFFNAVRSAVEYLRDILAIVNDYVTAIGDVARGAVSAGAQMLEQGLANAIPVAIGFLANQFGLGNIGEKIQEIVAGIRDVIDRALDWLMDQAERALQSVLGVLGFGAEEEEAEEQPPSDEPVSDQELENWWQESFTFTDPSGESHTLLFQGSEESATLVVRSEEQSVRDWLVARRESASESLRPVVEEASNAYEHFIQSRDNLDSLRAEFNQLSDAAREVRRDEYTARYVQYREAFRELARAFSAIPVETDPEEIVLRVPPQKPLSLYREHLGHLQHSKDRPDRHTGQVQEWERNVQAEMPSSWWDYGLRLAELHELPESRILRPNWDRQGASTPMQVDHRIEWQLRPIGDESLLDQTWNYELLDAAANSASGAAFRSHIEQERSRIAEATGDESWLYRDIETFTRVEGGGSEGRRWLFREIIDGEHLRVYANVYGGPPSSEELPSAESAAEERSARVGGAEAIEREAARQSILRSLENQYPDDAGKIRTLVELRMAGQTFEEIRAALGVGRSEFVWLREVVSQAGIHL